MAERKRFQKAFTAGRFTLLLTLFTSLILWTVLFFLAPGFPDSRPEDTILFPFIRTWRPEIGTIGTWLGYVVIGYILIGINNAFTVIRMRASAQTIFFLLLVSVYRPLHLPGPTHPATAFVVLSFILLFRSYQKAKPQSDIFHAFLLYGIGCFFLPQLVWFTPVMLLGAWNMQALYLKSFAAAVLGWSVPWWFLFGYAYFYEEPDLLLKPLGQMVKFDGLTLPDFSIGQLFLMVIVVFFVTVSAIHFGMKGYQEKIRTRVLLGFILIFFFVVWIAVLLQPALFDSFSALWMVLAAFLIGHFFTVTNSFLTNWLFILFMMAIAGLFLFEIWMILSGR